MTVSRLATFSFVALATLLVFAPAGFVSAQTLNGRTLEVNGTGAANVIRFSVQAGDVVVVSDGNETRFPLAQVDELDVSTLSGDDTIINNTAIPMVADAGPGDDYVVGGSGDDTIFGKSGDDSLFGRGGNDLLDGGSLPLGELDYLSGGNGDDVLRDADVMFGGNGDDNCQEGREVSGGAGDDFVLLRRVAVENVQLSGGPGNDTLQMFPFPVSAAQNVTGLSINGGPGFDRIDVSSSLLTSAGSIITGGPDFDLINSEPDTDLSIDLFGSTLYATGGPGDDTVTVAIESGQVVARVENAGFSVERTFSVDQVRFVNLYGRAGNDFLSNDIDVPATLYGEGGDDNLVANSNIGPTELYGGPGDDVVANSSTGPTELYGEAGDDLYMTNTNLDQCSDTIGNDVYILHGGSVTHDVARDPSFHSIMVFGSDRDEKVIFENNFSFRYLRPWSVSTVSHVDLGPGDDIFDGSGNYVVPVTVHGGIGNDILLGGYANNSERLYGDAGDDLITGEDGEGRLFGGAGDDNMYASAVFRNSSEIQNLDPFLLRQGSADSFMDGGPGDDTLHGSDADDTLFGGSGDDTLFGYDGDDVLRGLGGADLLEGGRDDDIMFGGTGNDRIVGDHGEDVLRGEGGNDVLDGGNLDDLLFGGPGSDDLNGGNGNDRLNGEGGVDTLDGGAGTNVLIQ